MKIFGGNWLLSEYKMTDLAGEMISIIRKMEGNSEDDKQAAMKKVRQTFGEYFSVSGSKNK